MVVQIHTNCLQIINMIRISHLLMGEGDWVIDVVLWSLIYIHCVFSRFGHNVVSPRPVIIRFVYILRTQDSYCFFLLKSKLFKNDKMSCEFKISIWSNKKHANYSDEGSNLSEQLVF